MRKILPILSAALSCATATAAAPGILLAGTVSRSGGNPLQGVAISLASGSAAQTTTGSDGKFRISVTSSVRPGTDASRSRISFSVDGSDLLVASDLSGTGAISIVSADGSTSLETPLAGSSSIAARLDLERLPPGIHRIVATIDGIRQSIEVLRLRDRILLGSTAPQAPAARALRSLATALDTLVAKKTGFVEKRIPLASYTDTTLSIAMDSATGTCPTPKPGTSKSNPIFTDAYTADPAVMVDNCTFYIQCGHDQGTGGFDLREWYLLKSTDMVNWTRTTPMSLKTFAWTNANAWAGQMVHARNGKYYWYVPINDIKYSADRMAIGVAVADSPEGPWKDALGKPLIRDSLEMSTWNITNIDQTPHTIDPTVFVDDDGQAYLQYGGFWTMVTAKLNPDMVSISGKLAKTTPPDYFESPYLIKRNNLYYEIYAHGSGNPTTIDYATSTSPMGPWTHKGTILDTLPRVAGQDAATNHAGVGQFAGQWYIVYHLSNGPNNGGTYRREVAIDKLNFNADGTIQKVTPSSALKF